MKLFCILRLITAELVFLKNPTFTPPGITVNGVQSRKKSSLSGGYDRVFYCSHDTCFLAQLSTNNQSFLVQVSNQYLT